MSTVGVSISAKFFPPLTNVVDPYLKLTHAPPDWWTYYEHLLPMCKA